MPELESTTTRTINLQGMFMTSFVLQETNIFLISYQNKKYKKLKKFLKIVIMTISINIHTSVFIVFPQKVQNIFVHNFDRVVYNLQIIHLKKKIVRTSYVSDEFQTNIIIHHFSQNADSVFMLKQN